MTKQDIKNAEWWLDVRYNIIKTVGTNVDEAYYKGALAVLEFLGLTWERFEDGKHKIYKK